MEALPEILQHQQVKIVVDPDYLNTFDPFANGMFIHEGQVHNGIKALENLIVIRSIGLAEECLWEEALHQWQYENSVETGFITTGIRQYMENQADIVALMIGIANGINVTSIKCGNIGRDSEITSAIQSYYSGSSGQYDLDAIESFLNSSPKFLTGDDFDYNWHEVLDMFFGGHSQSLYSNHANAAY